MKYFNFNNLKNLNPSLFTRDKRSYLEKGRFNLNKSQLSKPGIPYKDFNSGYIICEKNEIILDADSVQSIEFIEELIAPFRSQVRIEKTKNGKHYYLKIHENLNSYIGKKDVWTSTGDKIEIKGENSWVFSSHPNGILSDYYQIEEDNPITPLSEEDSEYLLSKLETLLSSGSGVFTVKNSKYLPDDSPLFASCVHEVVIADGFSPITFRSFFETCGYLFPPEDRGNIYKDQDFNKIKEGGRQNFLFRLLSKLGRTAQIVDKEEAISFLRIVNKEILDPPLPDSQLEATLNKKRFGYNINWFTMQDLKAIRKTHSVINIYQDASSTNEKQSTYYIVKKVSKVEHPERWTYVLNFKNIFLLLRKLAPGKDILLKELRAEAVLAEQYIVKGEEFKSGPRKGQRRPDTVDTDKIDLIYFIGKDGELGHDIDPFKPVDFQFDNGKLALDFTTQHYSNVVKQSSPDKKPSPDLFLEIPHVKILIENLLGNKERAALVLKDIRDAILNKRPINKANIFSGAGGIGKDAVLDFIADCFLYQKKTYYKRSQDDIRKGSQFNKQLADASIINLNEAGGSEKTLDSNVLSALNAYIGNETVTAEEKHQIQSLLKIHMIFAAISTNTGVDVSKGYNNTRFRLFNCPGARPFRNDKENLDYFFQGLTPQECVERFAEPFVNFVLYAPEIEEWSKNATDDSDYFDEIGRASYESGELSEFLCLIDSFDEKGNLKDGGEALNNLIQWVEKQEWGYEPRNQFESFKIRFYAILFLNLGGPPKDINRFKILNRNGLTTTDFNERNDTRFSTFMRLTDWLSDQYKKEGDFNNANKQKCKEIIQAFGRKLRISGGRVKFQPPIADLFILGDNKILKKETK